MNTISIGTRSSGRGSNSIEITGLTPEEADQLLSAIHGLSWFKVEEGRLKTSPCHLPLPHPTNDEEMLPFWKQYSNVSTQGEFFKKIFEEMRDDVIYMPHFTIQSLCGYNYTPENYARESAKLTSYGFVHLRSRRGDDGGFWEMWYLPGVWCAQGELKGVVEEITIRAMSWEDPHGRRKDKECFEAVLKFLGQNVSFGTLDVSIQRMCMVIE